MTYLEQRLQLKLNGKPKEEKVIKPIAKRSDKRVKEQREYVKIVKEMLAENPFCEMKLPGCQKVATGLHHQKKRAGNFLNRKYLIRGCNACQLRAEERPLEALKLGISLSKFP